MTFEQIISFIWPFILSTGLIAINEMGDKSQFLAIAFTACMKVRKVLIGIALAVLALNLLAVTVGRLLAAVPGWQRWIQLISGVLFLVFGVLALKSEKEEDESEKACRSKRFGDIAAVFGAFFFAEMGDKTQLVTVTLAAQYPSAPLLVLLGSSLGMLIADGLGILVGAIMHKKLPESALKFASAGLFLFFGLLGLWQSLHDTFRLAVPVCIASVTAAGILSATAGYIVYKKSKV